MAINGNNSHSKFARNNSLDTGINGGIDQSFGILWEIWEITHSNHKSIVPSESFYKGIMVGVVQFDDFDIGGV